MHSSIQIQSEPLDPWSIQRELVSGQTGSGALVSFVGLMRDFNQGDAVLGMELEHYPGMTEKALERILEEAGRRWRLDGVRVVHRIGALHPGDPIVLVCVTSAHRGEAFAACEFVIDYLKTRAPFWKKELTPAGERWVEARESDARAERRWGSGSTEDEGLPATRRAGAEKGL